MKTFVNKFNFLLLLAGLVLGSCSKNEPAETKEAAAPQTAVDSVVTAVNLTEAQFRNAGIKLGYLGDMQLSGAIKASGHMEVPAQSYAQVSTYIGAVVKGVLAQEGDQVSKGQAILILEHPDFIQLQREYIVGKNNLKFLEKEYQRQKELSENHAGTEKVYQEVESKYNAEKGNVASLESQLAMLSIPTAALDKGEIVPTISLKAPISGYLGHLNISLGAYAEPNKVLFDITDNSRLIVEMDIFEKDVTKIAKGQKVYIGLPDLNAAQIEGEVFAIGKSVHEESKTVSVKASVKDEQHILIPGMFVNAKINITDMASKVIPEDAVVRAGEKQYIFIATDAWCTKPNAQNALRQINTPQTEISPDSMALTYKMVEVETTSSSNGFVGVTSTDTIASRVVVMQGAYFLMSQLKSGETVGCCAPEEAEKPKE
jgi:cobalt-zinc-cadmium efflux system membrane fusion protein